MFGLSVFPLGLLSKILYLCRNFYNYIQLTNSDNISESELVASLRRGSVKAFNVIYKLYAKKLLSYVAGATKSKEDAEEIVHDIFLSLWKSHKNLDKNTDLSSFLFNIAFKRRVDLFRHSLTVPIYEDYMHFQNVLVSEDNNQLEYNEFCKLFNTALQALPSRLQTMLILSRIKGLTNEQIAQKLKISPKTVRNGMSLGLKLLKSQLDSLMNNHNY